MNEDFVDVLRDKAARKSSQWCSESHVDVSASSFRIYVNYIDWLHRRPPQNLILRLAIRRRSRCLAQTFLGVGNVFRWRRHQKKDFSDRFRKKVIWDFELKMTVWMKGKVDLKGFFRFFFLEYVEYYDDYVDQEDRVIYK